VEIRCLRPDEVDTHVDGLAAVLEDCVAGGASVGYVNPFPIDDARTHFQRFAAEAAAGTRSILAAFDGARIVGTVQVVPAPQPNQPHRADIAKLLVHRDVRRQGVAGRLMAAAEDEARAAGKTLLVLDTVTGDAAERLYTRLGWSRVGVIPNYALYPDGRQCATTVFYKEL
jgi:GNAT superfamily N-acetyltransferase